MACSKTSCGPTSAVAYLLVVVLLDTVAAEASDGGAAPVEVQLQLQEPQLPAPQLRMPYVQVRHLQRHRVPTTQEAPAPQVQAPEELPKEQHHAKEQLSVQEYSPLQEQVQEQEPGASQVHARQVQPQLPVQEDAEEHGVEQEQESQATQGGQPLPQVECPLKEGVQTYPHPEICDQFYLCSNGTLSLERCQNGLLFKGGPGATHHHCHYHWEVDCSHRGVELIPLSSDGCEYQFGLYAETADGCSNSYIRCEFGRPQYVHCAPGLAFDETIHRCNWADQMGHVGCVPEKLIGFECPTGVPANPLSARFWPYPRFAIEGDCEKLISCVNGHPRIVTCGDGMVVDDSTLTCEEPELVPNCSQGKRRK